MKATLVGPETIGLAYCDLSEVTQTIKRAVEKELRELLLHDERSAHLDDGAIIVELEWLKGESGAFPYLSIDLATLISEYVEGLRKIGLEPGEIPEEVLTLKKIMRDGIAALDAFIAELGDAS
jgi:hypothetical protein